MAGILVLHPGALGDVILALPALALLRERFPGVPLTLAGNTDYLPAVACGHAEHVTALSTLPLHRLYTSEPLPADHVSFWRSFDRIVAWTGFGDPVFGERLARLNPGSIVAGWRPGPDEVRHVSRIFVDTLERWLGDVADIPLPAITVAPENQAAADRWLDGRGWGRHPIVAVHPGAGNRGKRWPGSAAVVERLIREGECRVVVIEGPAEPEAGATVVRGLAAENVAVARSLPLQIVAGVLSRSEGYVGNDSGISHLAAGLGVASVVVFGPTSAGTWGPRGPRVEILQDARGCPACEGSTPVSHRCLENVRPETVLERLSGLRRVPRTATA